MVLSCQDFNGLTLDINVLVDSETLKNILEYHRKYDLTYSILDKKTIDIRKFDITKRLSTIHKSYKVYVIWELDWNRDKVETMKNVLRWINDNKKR